jgi:Fur family ferric uptake transcriptional regulator
MAKNDWAPKLRAAGLKVTQSRLLLLQKLASARKPQAVKDVVESLEGSVIDTATVYRSLEALEKAGMARRVDFKLGHAFYELAEAHAAHHHHVVCRSCGKVVDVDACIGDAFKKDVLKMAPGFAEITEHTLEFFGTCRACAEKKKAP